MVSHRAFSNHRREVQFTAVPPSQVIHTHETKSFWWVTTLVSTPISTIIKLGYTDERLLAMPLPTFVVKYTLHFVRDTRTYIGAFFQNRCCAYPTSGIRPHCRQPFSTITQVPPPKIIEGAVIIFKHNFLHQIITMRRIGGIISPIRQRRMLAYRWGRRKGTTPPTVTHNLFSCNL